MVTDMKCNRKRWSREDREFIEASVGKMTIEEMAEKADTIPYELMCRIKVKRIYI